MTYEERYEHDFCYDPANTQYQIPNIIDDFQHDGYVEETYKHYVVTGSHGYIKHDSNNPKHYTIPSDVRLVLYTSFCARSCTNNNSIKHNICTSINKSPQKINSVNMIAQDILFEGDIIPNLYAVKTPDRNESVEIHECKNSDSLKYLTYDDNEVSLERIILNITKSKQTNDIIIVHWTLCLTVDFIGMQTPPKCDERTLGVVRNSPTIFIKNIDIKQNTIHVVNTRISNILINLYITFPDKYSEDYIDILISFHRNIKKFLQILNGNCDISEDFKRNLTYVQRDIIYNNIVILDTGQEISITINANDIIRKIYEVIPRQRLEGIKFQDIQFMKNLIIISLLDIRKILEERLGFTLVREGKGQKKNKKRKQTKIRKDKQKNIKNRETKKDKQKDIKNRETKICKHKKNTKIRKHKKKYKN